jgi:hypothetical protein
LLAISSAAERAKKVLRPWKHIIDAWVHPT